MGCVARVGRRDVDKCTGAQVAREIPPCSQVVVGVAVASELGRRCASRFGLWKSGLEESEDRSQESEDRSQESEEQEGDRGQRCAG